MTGRATTTGPELWETLLTLAVAERYGKPVREWEFHPVRKWRFDLAWPALRVAFEREGLAKPGGKSRHTQKDGYAGDCEKYNEASLSGWVVIRATTRQIESGAAAGWLLRALELATGRATTLEG